MNDIPLVRLQNLTRAYRIGRGLGNPTQTLLAVDGVDLDFAPGRTLGLVGESGCGKSTLGRLTVGLERPTAGQVLYRNRPAWTGSKAVTDTRRAFQMIFQDPFSSLNPRKKIGRAIEEGLIIHGYGSANKRRNRVAEIMDQVGLRPGHADRYPHEFSGGQRQRVSIARALALEPEILVCDEPVSALDVSIQAQIINLFRELQKSLGLTLLFISHDLAVVRTMSHDLAVMYLGRIVEKGPSPSLYTTPAHPYTQALLAAVLVPDPDRTSEPTILEGEIPSPLHPPDGCGFHPRCPERLPACSTHRPPWISLGANHEVRCWLYAKQ
ncbi:MAG: ATP-binding cassette domain-containing protein [Deltaproteobacteria bacterium]|nr:ATP-binding cassette domain-containing protein [Deltaproteobacteria bacterium]